MAKECGSRIVRDWISSWVWEGENVSIWGPQSWAVSIHIPLTQPRGARSVATKQHPFSGHILTC
jgi:hypothetical protein